MKEPKLIRKIKKRSNEIVSAWKVAGFTKVYDIAIRPHCGNSKTALKRHLHKNEVIMETLRSKYGSLLSQYKSRTTQEGILPENAPVWVCWWQGESSMPEIVQICYQSLRKHTSHPIHLITKDSIGQYLQLPDFIEEKVQKGRITLTHLSDILRMALLAQYGGLWIDATVYVSQAIQEDIFHPPFLPWPHVSLLRPMCHRPAGQVFSSGEPLMALFSASPKIFCSHTGSRRTIC